MVAKNPPGTLVGGYIQALVQSGGVHHLAEQIAAEWVDRPAVAMTHRAMGLITRSEVPPLTVPSSPLVNYGVSTDFLALETGATIIGRLPGVRREPFYVRIATETSNVSSITWVPENAPAPMSRLALNVSQTESAKLQTIYPLSKETLTFSTPSAQAAIGQAAANHMGEALDTQFMDPSVGYSQTVRPASILNGVTPLTSAGTSLTAMETNLLNLMGAVTTGRSYAWICQPKLGGYIATKFGAVGAGFNAFGFPIVSSLNCPPLLALVTPSDIVLSDDGGVEILLSEEAAVIMSDSPASSPVSSSLVPAYQRNLVFLRIQRTIWWLRAHAGSAAYMMLNF